MIPWGAIGIAACMVVCFVAGQVAMVNLRRLDAPDERPRGKDDRAA